MSMRVPEQPCVASFRTSDTPPTDAAPDNCDNIAAHKGDSPMQNIIRKALVGLTITTALCFGADNSVGTWKMNLDKSKYTPAPIPVKSLTIVREASDGGIKVTISGQQADGT